MSAIVVKNLSKSYFVPVREAGLRAAAASLFNRQTREVKAVENVSFTLAPGELVGLLGPNGAGKTTTLKILSGLLHPTAGEAQVLGYTPFERPRDLLRQISLIMGNRNQLIWDIPALDSFELNQAIYRIPPAEFRRTRDEFIELLDMQELVTKPVRNLSLGERMKVEIAGALLHRPKVLFLDEPTIGLDVTMQRRIRKFIKSYNQQYGASVILTSHYMADVEALCERVIVIHHGRILFDGPLTQLVDRFSAYRRLIVTPENPAADLSPYGEVVEKENGRFVLQVAKSDTARSAARLLNDLTVVDLIVENPSVEDVIDQVFQTNDAAMAETQP
ncbi:MAG: ATP-binding cassette domain-containing protein [Chloroflexota bacterium]